LLPNGHCRQEDRYKSILSPRAIHSSGGR
jgi:hypothetical protein